ncbi:MAG: N-6 DNA methylase, partial [Endomicrobiia bacterium]
MQTKQEKLEKLQSLVNKFNQHIDNYKNPNYNETALRLEFLNPFFEILDWDVRNEENNHLNYTDVIVEERIDVYGSDNKKAPDYTFRIGGTKKFFVEAKKPSIDIKDAFEPAFQVRRYGHSAGLCLSILTDFEELSVYDTRKKPNKNDKPTKDRILYYKYTDYIEKFDEIYNLFSKTAIKQGSFEKFEKDDKHRKGNESIDEGILELVNDFREKLAKNIIKSNTNIDVPALNKAVIKIIDRLFFLRIAEDKEVEPYKTLFNITSHPNIYENLKKIFKESDRRYNSELFKYFKDIDGLIIEDKILKEIIINLYTPECVYEFSQIPVSILGSMYEQFLGKTIRITDGGHVKIEEKPEVKKAGGVYYTPEYIVNYIVKNTVGEKIKGLTPKEIEKIKILDPACGSGSFLIGAYQYLLDYHLAYYTDEKNLQKSIKLKLIRETRNGYILSIPEKQRILINNIFGVDIDQQAVEVAKFSLLLKLMESEDRETKSSISPTGEKEYQDDFNITGQIYHNMKILPNLNNNIKCGNSLIGTDYYNTINMELFEKDDYNKINAFDWDKEFSEIFKSGGFDCIIGNPPYIQIQGMKLSLKDAYQQSNFESFERTGDIYSLFYEKAIKLLNTNGVLGYITSNKWMRAGYGEKLRNFIITNTNPTILIDFAGTKIFADATVDTNILITKKNKYSKNTKCLSFQKTTESPKELDNLFNTKSFDCKFSSNSWVISSSLEQQIKEKIEKTGTPLKDWDINIYRGILTGYNEAFIIDGNKKEELIAKDKKSKEIIKPILRGRDIKRYSYNFADKWLILIPCGWTNKNYQGKNPEEFFQQTYPAIYNHFISTSKLETKGKGLFNRDD